MLRNPRLEALFGRRIDEVTYGDIVALIGHPDGGEAADLDYKEKVHKSDERGKAEFCKDIAAMANWQGGVLVLGVKEEPSSTIVSSVPGVDIGDGEVRRLRETAAARVVPHLDIDIRRLPDAPGSDHGALMVIVPRSTRAPHAYSDSRQPGALLYPVRDGSRTRYMPEPEVATRYRQRYDAATDLASRMDVVEAEAVTAFCQTTGWETGDSGPKSWRLVGRPLVVLTLVADLPGQARIDSPTLAEVTHALRHDKRLCFKDVRVASGRFLAFGAPATADPAGKIKSYAQLHIDGAGCHIMDDLKPSNGEIRISLEEITLEVVSAVSMLARHARDRTAASGIANLRLQIIASPKRLENHTPRNIGREGVGICDLQITRRTPPVEPAKISVHAPDVAAGRASGQLDGLADGGAELASAASLLVTEALHAFGIVNLPLIAMSGEFEIIEWRDFAEEARQVADLHGIPYK